MKNIFLMSKINYAIFKIKSCFSYKHILMQTFPFYLMHELRSDSDRNEYNFMNRSRPTKPINNRFFATFIRSTRNTQY